MRQLKINKFKAKPDAAPQFTKISFLPKQTRKSRPNMEVDTTPEEMIKNLKLNGYEHTKTKDGRDLLRKGDKTYTFYNSTGVGLIMTMLASRLWIL